MTTRWNPNSPNIIGVELTAYAGSTYTPKRATATAGIAQGFFSDSAESIRSVRVNGTIEANLGTARYLVELYEQGDQTTDVDLDTYTADPRAITGSVGTVTDFGGTLPPSIGDINDWPAIPFVGPQFWLLDGIQMTAGTTGAPASFMLQFDTNGADHFVYTGRVAQVAVEVAVPWGYSVFAAAPDTSRRVQATIVSGGIEYGVPTTVTMPNNDASGTLGRFFLTWGEINPVTGLPWTQADIRAFHSGAYLVKISRESGAIGTWRAASFRMVVLQEPTQRTRSHGTWTADTALSFAAWRDVPLYHPSDNDPGWSKPVNTDMVVMVRQADEGLLNVSALLGPNLLKVRTLLSLAGTSVPANFGTARTVEVANAVGMTDGGLTLSGVIPRDATALSPATLLAFVLMVSGGPEQASSDGQPYQGVRLTEVDSTSGANEQEVTATATDNYMGLRLMVGAEDTPDAALQVDLRQRSDDALITTWLIEPDEVTVDGTLHQVASVPDDGDFDLTNGVQYYLDFTSLATVPWDVGLLVTRPLVTGGTLYEEPTFNGGTDRASPIDGEVYTASTQTPADFMFLIDRAIDGPEQFVVSGSPLTVTGSPEPDCEWLETGCCAMTEIPQMRVRWTATSLGSHFAFYRLQRLRAGVNFVEATDDDWDDIAFITDEEVKNFLDVEARIGVWETYRMRVYADTGQFSDWTDPVANIILGKPGLTFTSNEAVDLSVGYVDVNDGGAPQRDYQFPEANERTFANFYGRDYTVGFRGTAKRGVSFARRLLVAALGTPQQGVGPGAAEPLRDLARASLSYVCVRDENGNRWLGSIDVPDLDVAQPWKVHRATLTFMETTATPSTPDSTVC